MIRHLLNKTLIVYRPSYATDAVGGRTRTRVQVGTVRAQVNQPSAAEREVAAQLGAMLTHVVYTLTSANVERGDELDADGTLLRVLAVVTNSRRTYARLECEAVQSE